VDLEFPALSWTRRFILFDSVPMDLYPACAEEMYSD
jgi:hypothetical protein